MPSWNPKPGDSGGEEEPFSYFDRWFQESRPWLRAVAFVLVVVYLLVLIGF